LGCQGLPFGGLLLDQKVFLGFFYIFFESFRKNYTTVLIFFQIWQPTAVRHGGWGLTAVTHGGWRPATAVGGGPRR
jgi:hypothetical protein